MIRLLVLAQALLALTFGVSFFAKVRSRDQRTAFGDAVQAFGFSRRLAVPIVPVVFGLEALAATLLAVGHAALLPGFLLSAALLSIFTVLLIRVLAQRRRVRCNCFGAAGGDVSIFDVARNLILIAVAVIGAILAAGTTVRSGALDAWDVLLLIVMAAVGLTLLLSMADIARTLRRPFTVGAEGEA